MIQMKTGQARIRKAKELLLISIAQRIRRNRAYYQRIQRRSCFQEVHDGELPSVGTIF